MATDLIGLPSPCDHPLRHRRVAAHRGASGHRPEHTLDAYRTAIRMGADDIEVDLVITRDGVLVARHDTELARTTDIADQPRLASRRRVGSLDGTTVRGWFVEDLTLAEVKRLGARERKPRLRPGNTRYDGREGVPTLDEVLAMAAAEGARRGRPVGVLLELKHPSHFAALGLPLLDPLLAALARHGMDGADSTATVMAFETSVLRELAARSDVPRVQLLGAAHRRPRDFVIAGDRRTYGDLATPQGLLGIAAYADAVGPTKELVLQPDEDGGIGAPSALVSDAHRLGLRVLVWTLRAENKFLPSSLRSPSETSTTGDMAAEVLAHLEAGVDTVITDHPDLAVAARDAHAARAAHAADRDGQEAS